MFVVMAIAIMAIAYRIFQSHPQSPQPFVSSSQPLALNSAANIAALASTVTEKFTIPSPIPSSSPSSLAETTSPVNATTAGLHPSIVVPGGAAAGSAVTALPAQLKSYDLTTPGTYPTAVDGAILDDFPRIGRNSVSNESASTNWWHYPTFALPSFAQITNNLRFFKNPDIGTCVRPEMCGALYHSKRNAPNEVTPLPPAQEGEGARVGYFRTRPADNQLYWSIPTNENILY